MPESHSSRGIDCARRAAERAAVSVHRDFSRGRISLHFIAWTAPLVGMLGTAALLVSVLRAWSLPAYATCDCAGGLSEAFAPVALSLPVATFASIAFHSVTHQVETLDSDMRAATLELLNHLAYSRER